MVKKCIIGYSEGVSVSGGKKYYQNSGSCYRSHRGL